MRLEDLIGFQLVDINDDSIVVKKNNVTHLLFIEKDEGDCCGFNELSTRLFISDEQLTRNPVITNVEVIRKEGDGDYHDCECCNVTLFGEHKKLAEVDSLSSSGSGWCYGANVTIKCTALKLNETLSQW